MAEHGATQIYRVPCKSCRGTILPYKQLSIRLDVDWPTNGGDNPYLIIEITDTELANSPFQPTQSSSVLLNTVHHHHHQHSLQQEGYGPTIRQENFFYHQQNNVIAMNDQNLINATVMNTPVNHDDSTITPTGLASPNEAIKRIANELKAQISSSFPQPRMPTPSFSLPAFHPNRSMPTISPLVSMTSMLHEPEMNGCSSNPSWNHPPSQHIVCHCVSAPTIHDPTCALASLGAQNSILPSASRRRSSNDQNGVVPFHPHANLLNVTPSAMESTITTKLTAVPNSKLTATSDLIPIRSRQSSVIHHTVSSSTLPSRSSDVDPYRENYVLCFRSTMTDGNQLNCPINPDRATSQIEQPRTQLTSVPQTKKRSAPRKSSKNANQLFQNELEQPNQQIMVLEKGSFPVNPDFTSPLTSPSRSGREIRIVQDSNTVVSELLTQSMQCSVMSDSRESSAPQRQSPQKVGEIRSPVKLDITVSQTTDPLRSISAAVDETISEVAHGGGEVSLIDTLPSLFSQNHQNQTKKLLPNHRTWEQDLSPNTHSFPYNLHFPLQSAGCNLSMSTPSHLKFQSVTAEQSLIKEPSTLTKAVVKRKPAKSKTATNPPKRPRKSSIYTPQFTANASPVHLDTTRLETATSLTSPLKADLTRTTTTVSPSPIPTTSPSHSDAVRTVVSVQTSSVAPVVRSGNQSVAWFGTPMPLESLGCDTTSHVSKAVVVLPEESVNTDSMSDLCAMSYSNDSARSDYFPNEQDDQFLDSSSHCSLGPENDDDFFSTRDEPFISLTPIPRNLPCEPLPSLPMSMSFASEVLTPALTEKPSSASTTATTNSNDFFDETGDSSVDPSSTLWPAIDNFFSPPPDPPTNSRSDHLLEQQHQYQSLTHTYSEESLQSQKSASNFHDTNSRTPRRMNDPNEIQPSSTPTPTKLKHQSNAMKTTPAKLPKRLKRPNVTPKVACTRCGVTSLIDITHHEFPKQKGLIFECTSCGNSSIRSNVSADERRRRLSKVAADHLNNIVCQFCSRMCHSHNEYLNHLKDDHGSNKPL